jgi:hypothetical protein
MTKSMPTLDWPAPGQSWRLVSDAQICRKLGCSYSHLQRLPNKPPSIKLGPRCKRSRSDLWDQYIATFPQVEAD